MLRPALHVIPESLRSFLTITEIDDAEFLVGELFQRKFKQPVPDFPRHIVALYRDGDGAQHLLSYSHMRPFGDIYLSGGSCSNGETVKRMQPHEREAMYAAGGSWFLVLKYAFERYADCCDAFIARQHRGASARRGRDRAENPPLRAAVSETWLRLDRLGCRAHYQGDRR